MKKTIAVLLAVTSTMVIGFLVAASTSLWFVKAMFMFFAVLLIFCLLMLLAELEKDLEKITWKPQKEQEKRK